MSERTPNPILDYKKRVDRQIDAFENFKSDIIKRETKLNDLPYEDRTPEGVATIIRRLSRMTNLRALTERLELSIRAQERDVVFDMDDLNPLRDNKVTYDKGFRISEDSRKEEQDIGCEKAKRGFFYDLSSTERFSFGRVRAPLLPWRRDLAKLAFQEGLEDDGELVINQTTRIPGVVVELYYPHGEEFPKRSLVNTPDKIRSEGE